jgi:ZIP family zinc transporter
MHENFVFALVLSGLASLATAFGSFLGMMIRRPGPRLMAFALGFSAGVMMFVSFGEMLRDAIDTVGFMPAVLAFFGGMAVMFLVDTLVPHRFISERVMGDECLEDEQAVEHGVPGHGRGRGHGRGLGPGRFRHVPRDERVALLRTGLLIAIGIGIHNLPEGMATFAGAIRDRGLGLAIAGAIALHNIPEGLAVALPVFCATGSRKKAFQWAFMSGAAEFAGALLAAAVLMPFLSPAFLAFTLAAVAGLMVFISLDELIPGSYKYGFEHISVAGVLAGMFVMALSIWALS